MGAKQTKVEDINISSSPIQCASEIANVSNLGPSSAAVCRDPISVKNSGACTSMQLDTVKMQQRDSNNGIPLDVLRKRFLKRFTHNVNDPRSPSLNLNRTPIVFENTPEKSFTLDDTFADLFVESVSKLSKGSSEEIKNNEPGDIEMTEEKMIVGLTKPPTTPQTPVSLQKQIDPRSPSIGVERTPILFTDDEGDETNEDCMLEGILATLSLNLNNSGDNSVVSITSQNPKNDLKVVPINKHLDRVRAGKKISLKAKNFRSKRPSQQKIYEDQENHMAMTPKLKVSQTDKSDSLKSRRTPLSCVRNRNGIHLRSRSVESSAQSIKTRLPMTSFDDTLNSQDSPKP